MVGYRPFTVLTGSCFWYKGATTQFQTLATYLEKEGLSPDINLLTGDQVYLDQKPLDEPILFTPYPLLAAQAVAQGTSVRRFIEDHITQRYRLTWNRLAPMLRLAGNVLTTDDHEWWNDYPRVPVPIWISLQDATMRKLWTSVAAEFIGEVQRVNQTHVLTIGNDLSFFIADTRWHRSTTEFMTNDGFEKMIRWIDRLKSPGVLVIGQPLVTARGDQTDATLADFPKQYGPLVDAIHRCRHDILVLSGDIHRGRLATAAWRHEDRPTELRRFYELTASPMRLVPNPVGGSRDLAQSVTEFPLLGTGPSVSMGPVSYLAGTLKNHIAVVRFDPIHGASANGANVEIRALELTYDSVSEVYRRQFSIC